MSPSFAFAAPDNPHTENITVKPASAYGDPVQLGGRKKEWKKNSTCCQQRIHIPQLISFYLVVNKAGSSCCNLTLKETQEKTEEAQEESEATSPGLRHRCWASSGFITTGWHFESMWG